MNYKTHLAFGIFVSLLVLKAIHIENQILFVIICAFFALLPDIDQSRSKFGRQFRPLSFVLKHRGLMHSIWVPLILTFAVYPLSFDLSLAIFVGYFSHLFTDSLTKKGIKFVWPLGWKIRGFATTGGKMEKVFFVVTSLMVIWMLL